jgi:hypothetical protein
MWKGTSLRAAAAAAALVAPLAACEAPPPPAPPPKVCDYITAEQNSRVQLGMTLDQVHAATGHFLKRTYYSVIELSTGPYTFESWSWDQDWDVNGCFQSVSYQFEQGRVSGISWMDVVK